MELLTPNCDPPAGVADRLLWRDAQAVARRHLPLPGTTDRCGHCAAGEPWPCPTYEWACRADELSYRRAPLRAQTGPRSLVTVRRQLGVAA
jgi:hypothetical protein